MIEIFRRDPSGFFGCVLPSLCSGRTYPESGIRARGVPVAIEVSPVRIRPEPGDIIVSGVPIIEISTWGFFGGEALNFSS